MIKERTHINIQPLPCRHHTYAVAVDQRRSNLTKEEGSTVKHAMYGVSSFVTLNKGPIKIYTFSPNMLLQSRSVEVNSDV